MRIIGVLGLTILLAGCAVAEKVAARNEYQKSEDSYKECMAANPTAPKNCEGQKTAMEAVARKRDSINTDLDFITNMKPGTPPADYGKAEGY